MHIFPSQIFQIYTDCSLLNFIFQNPFTYRSAVFWGFSIRDSISQPPHKKRTNRRKWTNIPNHLSLLHNGWQMRSHSNFPKCKFLVLEYELVYLLISVGLLFLSGQNCLKSYLNLYLIRKNCFGIPWLIYLRLFLSLYCL